MNDNINGNKENNAEEQPALSLPEIAIDKIKHRMNNPPENKNKITLNRTSKDQHFADQLNKIKKPEVKNNARTAI